MSLSAATPRAPDLSGCALDERYELHAAIGEGTFGRVYRGRDRRLARAVAVKVIKPWWADDPDWVGRFEREAQLMASVSDSGIVQIFDVGSAAEGPRPVTADEVKDLQAKYKAERAAADNAGLAKVFSPDWFSRADAYAKRADPEGDN